jgi:sugar lactone lactonase YvrE
LADGVSVAANGDIYISSGPQGNKITRVTPEGDVSIFATGFESANGSDFDSEGNLYVADYRGNAVRKIAPDGTFSTFADSLNGPGGVYVDHQDNVIVGLFGANFSGEGATVLKITPDGIVSRLATGNGLSDVVGVAGDGHGRIFAANWSSGELFEVTDGEVIPSSDIGGKVNQIDYADGYIYIPGPEMHKILRVDLDGNIELVAGTGKAGASDGPAESATFDRPNSCGLSPDGQILYVYDANTGHVRKIELMD